MRTRWRERRWWFRWGGGGGNSPLLLLPEGGCRGGGRGSGGKVPFARTLFIHGAALTVNVSGALPAAPPTPPAPPVTLAASRSPRLTASGFGAGEIRLPAFLALKPHPCGLPRPPANASARAMGPNTPRDNFRFLMGLKCRYAFKKIKRKAWIGGVISQRQKPLCKT